MIAKWIAQAMLRGENHIILSREELAIWQANGCRVCFGAPYGLHGQYIVRQIHWWKQALTQQLIDVEPNTWPSGMTNVVAHGNRTNLVLPALEFEATATGKWRVPLIPADPNHCLDAWAFDLTLNEEELEALRPVALQLARRMLIRCEIQAAHNVAGRDVPWNEGRMALAALAGVESIRQHVWFDEGMAKHRSPPQNAEEVDTEVCVEVWKDRQSSLAESAYRTQTLNAPRLISRSGDFVREMQIRRTDALQDSFNVKFTSLFLKSRRPNERHVSLDFNLSQAELLQMKVMIEESLGLAVVPLPEYQDIAMGVVEASARQEHMDGDV